MVIKKGGSYWDELDDFVPSAHQSNQKIAEKATDALAYLERTGNLDCVEALGLSEYKERNDV